jgi:osmotically-inducible protein OsmY
MNASQFRALTLLLMLSVAAAYARLDLANGAGGIDLARPGMPRPETMTDRRLHEQVARRLDHEPGTARVSIEVHDAIATLGGVVAHAADKDRVAAVALGTVGIGSIRNLIYVDDTAAERRAVAAPPTVAARAPPATGPD